MVLVAAAICPISTAGAELATPTKWCSAIQNRRYPHCSARWARSIVLCNAVAALLAALIGDRSRMDSGTVVTGAPPCTGWARRADRVGGVDVRPQPHTVDASLLPAQQQVDHIGRSAVEDQCVRTEFGIAAECHRQVGIDFQMLSTGHLDLIEDRVQRHIVDR